MTISLDLSLAVGLLVVHSLVHSIAGEKYILGRLFRRELPPLFGSDAFTKQTLRFAWHLTSVLWLGIATALTQNPSPGFLRSMGWTFLVCALFPLYFTRGKHLAWMGFTAIGLLLL